MTYNTTYKYEVYLGCGVKNGDTDSINISYIKSPDGNLHVIGDVC